MGKSLRSKNEQKNRRLKRESIFGEAAKQREQRIAERLREDTAKQLAQLRESLDTTAMDVDTKPKISTAGWKNKKKHGRKQGKASRSSGGIKKSKRS